MSGSGTKTNLATMIGGVLFVLFLALGLWGLQRAWAHNREIMAELDAKSQEVKNLITTKPYPPTPDNAKVLQQDRAKIDGLYQDLLHTAAHPIDVPQVSRVQFASMLAQKLADLLRAARSAKVATPDQFAFGFGDFLAVLPPDRQDVLTRLTRELLVVEKISKLLISNHAEEINQIRRLDPLTVTTGREANPTRTPDNVDGLYRIVPFEFQFVCSTDTLKSFLNSLAKSDWIFVVRSVTINVRRVVVSTRAGGAMPSSARPGPAPVSGGMPSPLGGGFGGVPPPMSGGLLTPEDARKTERDLLTVVMRIDLVELTRPQPKGRT